MKKIDIVVQPITLSDMTSTLTDISIVVQPVGSSLVNSVTTHILFIAFLSLILNCLLPIQLFGKQIAGRKPHPQRVIKALADCK